MTKLLGKAFNELGKLPPERQDELAAWILDFLAHEHDEFRLTPEEEAELRASLANPEFLSEEETAALYRRFGV